MDQTYHFLLFIEILFFAIFCERNASVCGYSNVVSVSFDRELLLQERINSLEKNNTDLLEKIKSLEEQIDISEKNNTSCRDINRNLELIIASLQGQITAYETITANLQCQIMPVETVNRNSTEVIPISETKPGKYNLIN